MEEFILLLNRTEKNGEIKLKSKDEGIKILNMLVNVLQTYHVRKNSALKILIKALAIKVEESYKLLDLTLY